MQPKVSVIIPVYNVEKYLRRCLDSVVNQTLKDIEIICIDDGSTDNSLAILKEYAAKDPRINILKQYHGGTSIARNLGLQHAKAEYIHFLDSDDFVVPRIYEELSEYMDMHDLDIYMFGHYDYYSDQDIRKSFVNSIFQNYKNKKIKIEDLIMNFLLSCNNKIYKHSFINNNNTTFPENIKIAEDAVFGAICAINKPRFDYVDKYYYYYRRENYSSITHNYDILIQGELDAHNYIQNQKCYKESSKNIQKAIDIRTAVGLSYQISRINNKESYRSDCTKYTNFLRSKYGSSIESNQAYLNLKLWSYDCIPVVIASDNTYAVPTATCIYSILENTKSFIDFTILTSNISKENVTNILESIKKFKNYNLKFVDVSQYIKDILDNKRFTKLACSRFFIPQILKNYDKVIYTDPDVIFKKDIKDYYNIDIGGYGLIAVPEEIGKIREGRLNHEFRKNIFKINQSHTYFASGNIILSCDYWRKHHITEKLCDVMKQYGSELVCPDLDVMNIVFANNYKQINYKYCCCVHRYYLCDGNKEMKEAFKDPFIIHYSGNIKPWKNAKVPYAKDFERILRKTKFKKIAKHIYGTTFEKVFSARNEDIRKVITIFGIKLKFKSKKLIERKKVANLENNVKSLIDEIDKQETLLQNQNDCIKNLTKQINEQINNVKMQNCIVLKIRQQFDNAIKSFSPQTSLRSIVYHLADHCNLKCQCCDHFAPIADEKLADINDFEKDIKRLSEITETKLDIIKLMGGEPLLHPQIKDFMRISRMYFPNSRIEIVTNGILLNSQKEDFWYACKEFDITIVPTKYPLNIDYDKAKQTAEDYKVKYEYYNKDESVIKTSYHMTLDLNGQQNPADSFAKCYHANWCVMLKNGKLYTCTVAPNIEHFNKYFNKDIPLTDRDGIDIYKAQSIDEILNFLSKPIPFCKYCNVNGRTFGHEWGRSEKRIEEWT